MHAASITVVLAADRVVADLGPAVGAEGTHSHPRGGGGGAGSHSVGLSLAVSGDSIDGCGWLRAKGASPKVYQNRDSVLAPVPTSSME